MICMHGRALTEWTTSNSTGWKYSSPIFYFTGRFEKKLIKKIFFCICYYFFSQITICAVASLMLSRYRDLKLVLGAQLSRNAIFFHSDLRKFLKNAVHFLCVLKETCDIFNAVFGWHVLLVVCYSSLQLLNYLDETFNNFHDSGGDLTLGSNVSFVLITMVNTLILIILR